MDTYPKKIVLDDDTGEKLFEEDLSNSSYKNFNSIINDDNNNNLNNINNLDNVNNNIIDVNINNEFDTINKLINDLKPSKNITLQAEIDRKINYNSLNYLLEKDREENLSIISFKTFEIPEENQELFKKLKPISLLDQIKIKHNNKIKEIQIEKREKFLNKLKFCKTDEEKEKLKLKYLYNNILQKPNLKTNKKEVLKIVENSKLNTDDLISKVKTSQKKILELAQTMEDNPELKNKIYNLNLNFAQCLETANDFKENIYNIKKSLSLEPWVQELTNDLILNRDNERATNLLLKSSCPEAKKFLEKKNIFKTNKIIEDNNNNKIEIIEEEKEFEIKKLTEDDILNNYKIRIEHPIQKMEIEEDQNLNLNLDQNLKLAEVVEFNEDRMEQIEIEQRQNILNEYLNFKRTKINKFKFNKKLDLIDDFEDYNSDLENKIEYKRKYNNKYKANEDLKNKEECQYCKKVMSKKSLLYDHNCSKKLKILKIDDKKFCEICLEYFKPSYFKKHLKVCIGETNCIYCLKPVKKELLERHMHHFNCRINNQEKLEKKFMQPKFDKDITIKESFIFKKIKNAEKKDNKCDFCRKIINKSKLARHLINCYNFKFFLINPAIFKENAEIFQRPTFIKDKKQIELKNIELKNKINELIQNSKSFEDILKFINDERNSEIERQNKIKELIPTIIDNNKNNSDVDFKFKFKKNIFSIFKELKHNNINSNRALDRKEKELFKLKFKSEYYSLKDAVRYNINKYYNKKLIIFPTKSFKTCLEKSVELEYLNQKILESRILLENDTNINIKKVVRIQNLKDELNLENDINKIKTKLEFLKNFYNKLRAEDIILIFQKVFLKEEQKIVIKEIKKILRVFEIKLDIAIKIRENYSKLITLKSKLFKKNKNDLIEEEFKNFIRKKIDELVINQDIYSKYQKILDSRYTNLSFSRFEMIEDFEEIEDFFIYLKTKIINPNKIIPHENTNKIIREEYQNIIKDNKLNHIISTENPIDFLIKEEINKEKNNNKNNFNLDRIVCFSDPTPKNLELINNNIKSICEERNLNFIKDYIFDDEDNEVINIFDSFEWPASRESIQKAYQNYLIKINNNIFPPVLIQESFGKGYGLFALEKIKINTLLFCYVGKIIRHSKVYNNSFNGFFTLIPNKDPKKELLIDPRIETNFGYFVNGVTRCSKTGKLLDRKEIKTKNIEAKTERIIIDNKISSRIIYYSCKDIEVGEELIVDYGRNYWLGFN